MSTEWVSVCQVEDLDNGQMRQFKVGDRTLLLARRDNQFYAIAAFCSHYGAPLHTGVMSGDRVVCPWHNACFSLKTGALLEPPGRNHLAHYPVRVDGADVCVDVSGADAETAQQQLEPVLVKPDGSDDRTFAIIGGGAAGSAAAEMLRRIGYKGRLVMLTADDELPYDRTALSKKYLQSDAVDDPTLLRSPEFYDEYGIEVKTNARVHTLDVAAKQLTYGDGDTLSYDSLLLATGGKVRSTPVDGADLQNVFTLRRAEDAAEILQLAHDAKRAVIVGSGFIGMEVAASLKQQGLDVTVVTPDSVPFERVLGTQVGQLFQKVHEEKGVRFKLGTKASAFKGESSVQTVELENGETLATDLVVVGIGVKPATDFIDGLSLDERDRSVVVDEFLQAAPDVFAAGDIARFPFFMTGDSIRVEHWRTALQQGRVAAANMVDKSVSFRSVPFFWTGQFGLKLRYVGHAEAWDDVIIHGSLDDKSFLSFYVQDDQVLAVAGIGRDRDIAAISELMRLSRMPAASDIRNSDIDWVETLSKTA